MSVLDNVLQEEYERSVKMRSVMRNELDKQTKGYISIKTINGKPYSYLQFKENGKIRSQYLHSTELKEIEIQIEKRKQLQKSIKELDANIEKLERVLK